MQFVLQPWELAFAILASWINGQQQESNDYLRTENQVLREYIGKKRILLNDNQRRRLAVKGKMLDSLTHGHCNDASEGVFDASFVWLASWYCS